MSEIKQILTAIKNRETQNDLFLHLTVNENQLSQTARTFLGSKLSERYYFGPGDESGVIDFKSFTFLGMPEITHLEEKAKDALKKMAHAESVNLDNFSGLHAMMNTLLATTEPGDTVLSLHPEDGGHLATKGIIEKIGRKHAYATFNQDTFSFDAKKTAETIHKTHATTLYIDISVYLHPVNISELREALGPNITIIFDASHTLGLILGGTFQSPLQEGADVMCANTHKTFAGPQRGVIMFKDADLGEKTNQLIATTLVSSVHINTLTALCISILEYEKFGSEYAQQVIKNSQALAKELQNLGHEIRHSESFSTISENEQVHAFVDTFGDRVELYRNLISNNISTNFMMVLGGRPFARLGTQEITRRGMKETDMALVASLYDRALRGENVTTEVIALNKKFNSIHYSFDQE